jgi:hypothetical protein
MNRPLEQEMAEMFENMIFKRLRAFYNSEKAQNTKIKGNERLYENYEKCLKAKIIEPASVHV